MNQFQSAVKWRWLAAFFVLAVGGALGWFVHPLVGIGFVAGISGWLLAFRWPEVALAFVTAGFQLYPVAFEMLGLHPTQVTSGLIYAILTTGAVAGALMANPARAWRRLREGAGILFVVMSLYFIVSWLVLTPKTPSAIQKMRYTLVIMIPSFLAALWLEKERIIRFAWSVVLFSALGALAGGAKRMLGLIPPTVKRLSLSTTSRSLQFAYSVGVGGLFSWILARKGSARLMAWATFFGFIAFLMVLATGSRGAFLALSGSLLLFFVLSGQWRRFPMLLLIGAFLAALWIAPLFVIEETQSTQRIFNSLTQSAKLLFPQKTLSNASGASNGSSPNDIIERITTQRVDHYKASLKMLSQHPLFGTGYGGYNFTNDPRQRYLYPHNYLLEVAAETGLVGLALFSVFLAITLWRAFRLLWRQPDNQAWIAVLLMVYALIAGWVSYSITYHAMLWVSLGLVLSLSQTDERRAS